MKKLNVKRHKVIQPKYYRLIPLTQGQNAEVNARDYKWLSQWNWHAQWNFNTKSYYASVWIDGKTVLMHRLIMGAKKSQEVDHKKPWDTLNNRRSNLRMATGSQNLWNQRKQRNNTSGYKGVSKNRGIWHFRISKKGMEYTSYGFTTAEQANKACQKLRKKLHGEFARVA